MPSTINLAVKILLHDQVRFLITVSGVGFAVMLVFVQVGLFNGLLVNASITIDRMDADLWITGHNTPNIELASTFPEMYVHRVRSVPGVARADALIAAFLPMTLPNGVSESVMIYGMENFPRWGWPWNVNTGVAADIHRGPYFMLDRSAVRRFGPFAEGDHREINAKRFRIIGVTDEAKSFTTTPIAFMDYRRLQAVSPDLLGGRTHFIVVKLEPGADPEKVRAAIAQRLPFNDIHTRDEWAARSRNYWIESTGLGLNMFLTVFLGCLVGVLVVAQTLYTSTMDHLREFATVKAIGGSNWNIYGLIAEQAALVGLLGFLVGWLAALALRPLLALVDLKLALSNAAIGSVFLGTIVLCLVSSTLSFRRVASVDPAMVFRN